MNHREITKKYSELLNKVEFANGRREIVSLLKPLNLNLRLKLIIRSQN